MGSRPGQQGGQQVALPRSTVSKPHRPRPHTCPAFHPSEGASPRVTPSAEAWKAPQPFRPPPPALGHLLTQESFALSHILPAARGSHHTPARVPCSRGGGAGPWRPRWLAPCCLGWPGEGRVEAGGLEGPGHSCGHEKGVGLSGSSAASLGSPVHRVGEGRGSPAIPPSARPNPQTLPRSLAALTRSLPSVFRFQRGAHRRFSSPLPR